MKRINTFISASLFSFLLLVCDGCTNSQSSPPEVKGDGELYQCIPCGADCDNETYNETGECSDCHMQLVKKSSITFKSIQPTTICDYIKNHPEAILLDVRTKKEFEGKANPDFGTLKNAINIPIQELESQLASISHLKSKEILVFCSHSHRSPRASYILTQKGFIDVTNMEGGMSKVTDPACKK